MTLRITYQPTKRDYETIKKLVAEGKYRSQSDFIHLAVKRLIEDEVALGSPELDEATLRLIRKALRIKE